MIGVHEVAGSESSGPKQLRWPFEKSEGVFFDSTGSVEPLS
jgi:hypothetical protein